MSKTFRCSDRASTAWQSGYRDACDATRVLHKQPEAALRLRLDCLDQKRLDLRAIAQVVGWGAGMGAVLWDVNGKLVVIPESETSEGLLCRCAVQ